MNFRILFIIMGPRSHQQCNKLDRQSDHLYLFAETGIEESFLQVDHNLFLVTHRDPGNYLSFHSKSINFLRFLTNCQIPSNLQKYSFSTIVRLRSDSACFTTDTFLRCDLNQYLSPIILSKSDPLFLPRKGSRRSIFWKNNLPFFSDLYLISPYYFYIALFHQLLPSLVKFPLVGSLCAEELFGFCFLLLSRQYNLSPTFCNMRMLMPTRFYPNLLYSPRAFVAYFVFDRSI